MVEVWSDPSVIRDRCERGGLRQAATRPCAGTHAKRVEQVRWNKLRLPMVRSADTGERDQRCPLGF